MSMTEIVINGPSDGSLINCVHLWNLKSVDNLMSFLKDPHKVLLGMRHGNRTSIINSNGNYIGVNVSLARLSAGVGCTSRTSDV